jgi:RND family efflux transporter MFP subunit
MPVRHKKESFHMTATSRVSPFALAANRKVGLLSVLVCSLGALFALAGCDKKEVAEKPAPPEVMVAEVAQQNVPIFEEWVSILTGPVNADITPKVQGYLLQQNYQNGYVVKKGQLLFELDPRQYQAALEQAQAQVAVAQAALSEADTNVARDTPLAAQNAIPQKQLDTDLSLQAARKAQVEAAKANLENAKLNLAWTKVYSPIDGIAGNSNSQVGDLVGTTTKMATVSQTNPIWANFNISESAYLKNAAQISNFIRTGKAGNVPVKYIQANNEEYPRTGRIIQVNRQVASGTGTIQFTAEFPNPDALLRPGGFGMVRIQTADNKDALLVPQPSVIEVQSQYQILVVTPENKAMFRPIKVGARVGTNWIVTEGLKPGERVVVEGIQKLQMAAAANPQFVKDGIPVSPKPYQAPNEPAAGSN